MNKLKRYKILQTDIVVTEFITKAKDKKDAEHQWYHGELTETRQSKTIDRGIDVERMR